MILVTFLIALTKYLTGATQRRKVYFVSHFRGYQSRMLGKGR